MEAGSVVQICQPARGLEAGIRGVVWSVDDALGTVTVALETSEPVPPILPFSPGTLGLVAQDDAGPIHGGHLSFPRNRRSTPSRPSEGSGRTRFSNESRAVISS